MKIKFPHQFTSNHSNNVGQCWPHEIWTSFVKYVLIETAAQYSPFIYLHYWLLIISAHLPVQMDPFFFHFFFCKVYEWLFHRFRVTSNEVIRKEEIETSQTCAPFFLCVCVQTRFYGFPNISNVNKPQNPKNRCGKTLWVAAKWPTQMEIFARACINYGHFSLNSNAFALFDWTFIHTA